MGENCLQAVELVVGTEQPEAVQCQCNLVSIYSPIKVQGLVQASGCNHGIRPVGLRFSSTYKAVNQTFVA